MKAIRIKSTGEWVCFYHTTVCTSSIPQLFPDTSSLEGIKQFNKDQHNVDLDISDLEMIEVDLVIRTSPQG